MASVLEASSHSYLGDQLRDTRARSNVSVDLNKTYRILLIPLADIVLFPGETIPLRIHNPNMVQNIQRIVEETESNESLGATDGTCDFIGVVNNPRLDQYRTVLCRFGTTIDVRSISIPRKRDAIVNNENETLTRHEELVLTAKGKLRFQIINVHHSNQSIIFACAKLLPDAKVTSAHHSAELYAFPKWVYEVNSPATLARRAYQMVEKSIFWKVRCIAPEC